MKSICAVGGRYSIARGRGSRDSTKFMGATCLALAFSATEVSLAYPTGAPGQTVGTSEHGSPDSFESVSETTWVIAKMHRVDPSGVRFSAELLRPVSWVRKLGLVEGESFEFTTSEPSFSGLMTVDSIHTLEDKLGRFQRKGGERMVTGRFITSKAQIYRLHLEDGTEVAGTAGHPLFSVDRDDWVGIAELIPEERLRTRAGTVAVSDVVLQRAEKPVFNLEVHGQHQYFVTSAEVLSHNMNAGRPCDLAGLDESESSQNSFGDVGDEFGDFSESIHGDFSGTSQVSFLLDISESSHSILPAGSRVRFADVHQMRLYETDGRLTTDAPGTGGSNKQRRRKERYPAERIESDAIEARMEATRYNPGNRAASTIQRFWRLRHPQRASSPGHQPDRWGP